LVWDWEKEAIGVTTGDVELSERNISETDVDFILDKKDKSPPTLLNCQSVHSNLVALQFDEELEKQSVLDLANFRISSVSTQMPLRVISAFFRDTDTRRIFLLIEQMRPEEKYELKVMDVRDKVGNSLDTTSNLCLFDGTEIPDTLGPKIAGISPKHGETNVPFDAKIKLAFDEPPDKSGVEAVFSLVNSTQVRTMGKGEWETPNTFVFSPDSLLSGKMPYMIKLSGEQILDLFGNISLIDSIFGSSFVTLNPDTLGSVAGKIEIKEEDDSATVVLTLWSLEQDKLLYQITTHRSGLFLFERVLPGKYFLSGYLDLNEDENLTLGEPEPFSPLEPFLIYPDTIYVRSRWETEGIGLKFHKYFRY